MAKRHFFYAFFIAVWSLLPAQAAPAQLSIDAINRYLNSLQEARGSFVQYTHDSTRADGTFFIKKPGRLRMEYAPPHNGLIIAGAGRVAIFDPLSDDISQQFPLARTPLSLLLKRKVDIAPLVVDHTRAGQFDMITIKNKRRGNTPTAQGRDKAQEKEVLVLWFAHEPIALAGWTITNALGEKTEIRLANLTIGESAPAHHFNINYELEKRQSK